MIAKRIDKAPDVPDDFTHLADYIAAAREEGEKLGEFWIANCDAGADLADLDAATAEVEAVRQQKPDVLNKTYHLVISFHPGEGERLDKEALQDIVSRYAEALGFAEHQYVAGSHINTDNLHIHVAFNRVHPRTLKVHAPYNDFKALETVSRALEKTYGLTVDRGMSDPKPETTLSPGARDFEANTWQQSFQRHVLEHRGEILAELKHAADWQAVHAVLARYDIRLKPHGAGLVLTDPTGRQTMKASALHRSCSKSAMETRFGRFQPARFADEVLEGPAAEDGSPTAGPDDAPPPVDPVAPPTDGPPADAVPETAPAEVGDPAPGASTPAGETAAEANPPPHTPPLADPVDPPTDGAPAGAVPVAAPAEAGTPAPGASPPAGETAAGHGPPPVDPVDPPTDGPPPPPAPVRLPPIPPPRPIARYTPRPLLRRPGMAPLWR
ncbi:TraI/MobA(P) family conjugative relaxase, partial [Caenispirillum bisanense]|uniref:TraI/MobA(P) family conjugative relaxase n=1 Tax=Caenispirillum bisanense TaxID=414052 RepID=UPI0031D2A945